MTGGHRRKERAINFLRSRSIEAHIPMRMQENLKEIVLRDVTEYYNFLNMSVGAPTHGVSRAQATVHQITNDLVQDIKGKDMLIEPILGVRNAAVALFHGVQGIIPSAANAFSGQRYGVVERRSLVHGTMNSIRKVIDTRGILGKASAVLAEATDGPVEDLVNVTTGGANWMVVPEGAKYSLSA